MQFTSVIALVLAIVEGSGRSQAAESAVEPTVIVCMERGRDPQAIKVAEESASQMFAGAGVTIDWLHYPRTCPSEKRAIVVSLSYQTPQRQLPNAWAYALPYEGTHIVLFYDRLQRTVVPARVPILLAHVLVHEITHILQGTVRHSDRGIMKAQWAASDFFEMGRKPLGFTSADVAMIRRGMEARQSLIAPTPSSRRK